MVGQFGTRAQEVEADGAWPVKRRSRFVRLGSFGMQPHARGLKKGQAQAASSFKSRRGGRTAPMVTGAES